MRMFSTPRKAATVSAWRISRDLAVLLAVCTAWASTAPAQGEAPPAEQKAPQAPTEKLAEQPGVKTAEPTAIEETRANAAEASATAQESETSPPDLALIKTGEMPLRCFATEHSPRYEDVLAEGAAVQVGERYGSYRRVMLPLGPIGYVHKRYASMPEAGMLKTVGEGVSFRYRPKSSEAPVTAMEEGTELWVIGEEKDWWKVRLPGGEVWAPEADLEVFDAPNETLELAWQELMKTHRAVVDELVAAQAAALAASEEMEEQRQALTALLERYRQETRKRVREQDYAALAADLEVFLASAPDELKPAARDLGGNIERMQWAIEATVVVQDEPVPHEVDPALVAPEKRDSLARFDTIGWLRYHPGRAGPARYTVEKGGQVLFWVICSTNRYDLRLFADKELGLVGPAQRPSPDSMRVLDVERIEVLGVPRE